MISFKMRIVVVFKASTDLPKEMPMSMGSFGSIRVMSYLSHNAKTALEQFDYSLHELNFCPLESWSIESLDPFYVYFIDPILKLGNLPLRCYYLDESIQNIDFEYSIESSALGSLHLNDIFCGLEAKLTNSVHSMHTIEAGSIDLPSFSCSPIEAPIEQLLPISLRIFKCYEDVLANLLVSEDALYKFLQVIYSLYICNDYHNFYHAVDVLQCSHFILSDPILRSELRDIDVFALLISAVCHDVGHLGVNNGFLISYKSDLALLYNDASPLENYHSFLANYILEKIDVCDFRRRWDRTLKQEFRKLLITSILSTDMAHHYRYISLYRSKEVLDSDRSLLLGMILKAADLSNVVRPFKNSEKWSHCLKTEFYLQGELEKKLGYRPISKNMDKDADVFPESQASFLEVFALPLFKILIEYYPSLHYMLDNLVENIEEWRRKIKIA